MRDVNSRWLRFGLLPLLVCSLGQAPAWATGPRKAPAGVSAPGFRPVQLVSTGWGDVVSTDQVNVVSYLMEDLAFTAPGETNAEVAEAFGKKMDGVMAGLGFRRLDAQQAEALHRFSRDGRVGVLATTPVPDVALHYVPASQEAFEAVVKDPSKVQLVGSRSLGRVSGVVRNIYVQVREGDFKFDSGGATFHVSLFATLEGEVGYEGQLRKQGRVRLLSVDPGMVTTSGLHQQVMGALKKLLAEAAVGELRRLAEDCGKIEDEARANWASKAKAKGLVTNTASAVGGGLVEGGKNAWSDRLKQLADQVEAGKVPPAGAKSLVSGEWVGVLRRRISTVEKFVAEEENPVMWTILKKRGDDPASEMGASRIRMDAERKVMAAIIQSLGTSAE